MLLKPKTQLISRYVKIWSAILDFQVTIYELQTKLVNHEQSRVLFSFIFKIPQFYPSIKLTILSFGFLILTIFNLMSIELLS